MKSNFVKTVKPQRTYSESYSERLYNERQRTNNRKQGRDNKMYNRGIVDQF